MYQPQYPKHGSQNKSHQTKVILIVVAVLAGFGLVAGLALAVPLAIYLSTRQPAVAEGESPVTFEQGIASPSTSSANSSDWSTVPSSPMTPTPGSASSAQDQSDHFKRVMGNVNRHREAEGLSNIDREQRAIAEERYHKYKDDPKYVEHTAFFRRAYERLVEAGYADSVGHLAPVTKENWYLYLNGLNVKEDTYPESGESQNTDWHLAGSPSFIGQPQTEIWVTNPVPFGQELEDFAASRVLTLFPELKPALRKAWNEAYSGCQRNYKDGIRYQIDADSDYIPCRIDGVPGTYHIMVSLDVYGSPGSDNDWSFTTYSIFRIQYVPPGEKLKTSFFE